LLDVFHEVLFFLVDACREALFDGGVDSSLDATALLLRLGNSLFFSGTRLPTFLASQIFTEIGVCTALIIEVDSVG
jgi:hypothetical protein